jgi:hypothetical protein
VLDRSERIRKEAAVEYVPALERLRSSKDSVLAFGTQVRGFAPGRSRRIFRAKKSSQRLPSEEKSVVALRHAKDA